jgi:hypothetical protein
VAQDAAAMWRGGYGLRGGAAGGTIRLQATQRAAGGRA